MNTFENSFATALNNDQHFQHDSEAKSNLQSRMGINALSNSLSEICAYLGENPLEFIERNSFYFNRKLENRKKYFFRISLDKTLSQAEKKCQASQNNDLYEKNLSEIKNLLLEDKLISRILNQISVKQIELGKKFVYELIIPIRERINANEEKLDELFKFYCKTLHRRNPETLVKVFLDKLFNPNNFDTYSELLIRHCRAYRESFEKQLPRTIQSNKKWEIGITDSAKVKLFVNKYFVEKMKNMYDVRVVV